MSMQCTKRMDEGHGDIIIETTPIPPNIICSKPSFSMANEPASLASLKGQRWSAWGKKFTALLSKTDFAAWKAHSPVLPPSLAEFPSDSFLCTVPPPLPCFHPRSLLQFVKANTADPPACKGTKDGTDLVEIYSLLVHVP